MNTTQTPTLTALEVRAAREWSEIAQEPVTVNEIASALCAFGSELACLRLFHRMPKGRAGYSTNRSTWYFAMERRF